jgi:hypothetical protein
MSYWTTMGAPVSARHLDGMIYVTLEGDQHLRFPVSITPRLSSATAAQLANIELLPLTLHWPDVDEDLSIESLIKRGYAD